jgi:methionyl-tRNA formyltransferase
MIAPAVKEVAAAMGYPVLQPPKVKDPWFLERIIAMDPELFVVVAYGRLLPASFLSIPRIGAINIHASLLPKYRGPAPIQWAIINGEDETGVTTIWMDEGLDTGDILLSTRVPIGPEDTTGSLSRKLAEEGGRLLIETLSELKSDGLAGIAQDKSLATYAPLLTKEDGRIDWSKDAMALDAFVRGMNPWPGAFTFLAGKRLKVLKVKGVRAPVTEKPGTVIPGFPGDLIVATGRGSLGLLEVQLESSKRLPIRVFLRGFPVSPGTHLG